MDKKVIINKITECIKKYLSGDYKIFLFGSWAKGGALETSDIDIGIYGKKEVPWDLMVKILGEVEEIPTLRKIDVLDLNAKEKIFRDNVLSYAKPL